MRILPASSSGFAEPKSVEVPECKSSEPAIKVTLVNTPLKVDALCRKLDKYKGFIGFDTEVVGPLLKGRDFVNITRSCLLGLSLSFEDGKNYYVPFRHKGNCVTHAELAQICTRIQWRAAHSKVWAHNAKFDHQVMAMAGFPMERLLCSMIAAWLITGKNKGIGLKPLALQHFDRECPEYDPSISHKTGDAVKVYAGHDSRNTLQLGCHYRTLLEGRGGWDWFITECDFTTILAEMKLQGMRLDHGKLRGVRFQATKELNRIKAEWDSDAPDISITSSKQLQELFTDGTWTIHGQTDTGAVSTGKKAMEWNALNAKTLAGRRLAELRLEYQEVSKIVTTYTDGLIEESLQWLDEKLHPDLFHFGTVTGRLASANPNIQNQPVHGSWAARVRACFIPEEGMEFTAADYSQVELRYFAEYCGKSLFAMFMDNQDLHQRTADAMNISRKDAKTVNFGFLLYGGGPDKLAEDLGCSSKEATLKIKALHAEYPEVEEWRQHVLEVVKGRGTNPWAKTLAGRIRYFPELNPAFLKRDNPDEYKRLAKKYRAGCLRRGKKPTATGLEWSVRGRGERLVVNYLIQGGARDLLVLGMNKYRRRAPAAFTIITTVHDEVLTQHPIGRGEEARALLQSCLESAGPMLGLKVPILAEPKTGSTWAEVK
jgi:DNA polymerase-1